MDANEATTIVLSKIQKIDPENASKIMGYLLLKDLLTEKDLIRLAFGSETLMQNIVLKAKTQMGLSSSTSSAPVSPSNPFNSIPRLNNPTASNTHLLSQSSPRITPRGNEYDVSNPFSGYVSNTSFSPPISNPLRPFENTHMGSLNFQSFSLPNGSGSNTTRSSSLNTGDFVEEQPFNEYFSFLNDSVRHSGDFGDMSYGVDSNGETHLHRRSYSESDVCFGPEDGSFSGINGGFRPCLYFARGFCKNGSNCKFVHGSGVCDDFDGGGSCVSSWGGSSGSPSGFDPEEIMRLKIAHQQRLASIAAAVAGSPQFMPGTSPVSQHKYMNFLLQQRNEAQRMRMMMGDESYKYGRYQPDRNEFLAMGLAEKANSASRQIYLTFPADSTFKDEDVAEYFSTFGPVQDVRIPYQQKRMFGFVTFVYPETVKLILAKGNPHFICNSRVLVKPYKEKGKVPEKRQQVQQQHFERGEFSPSSSNLLGDSMEPFDQLGARVYNSHEMILRRKLEEQADLQQAIELQSRRLINLQLPDLKADGIHHCSLSVGSPISLPVHPLSRMHHENAVPSDVSEECWGTPPATLSSNISAAEQQLQCQVNDVKSTLNGIASEDRDNKSNAEASENQESLEHILPDSLFASPTKSAADHPHDFSKPADPNDGIKSSSCVDNKSSQAMNSSSD